MRPRALWRLRGIVLSLAPSAFQLVSLFPHDMGTARSAWALRMLTPDFLLALNAIWRLATAWPLHNMTGPG